MVTGRIKADRGEEWTRAGTGAIILYQNVLKAHAAEKNLSWAGERPWVSKDDGAYSRGQEVAKRVCLGIERIEADD